MRKFRIIFSWARTGQRAGHIRGLQLPEVGVRVRVRVRVRARARARAMARVRVRARVGLRA